VIRLGYPWDGSRLGDAAGYPPETQRDTGRTQVRALRSHAFPKDGKGWDTRINPTFANFRQMWATGQLRNFEICSELANQLFEVSRRRVLLVTPP
jgi:hypothetical protein